MRLEGAGSGLLQPSYEDERREGGEEMCERRKRPKAGRKGGDVMVSERRGIGKV